MQAHEEHDHQTHDGGEHQMLGQRASSRDAHGGHDRHESHSIEMFRNRFWVCLFLTLPVLAYAEMLWDWLGLGAPDLPAERLVPFILGTLIFAYGGEIFRCSSAAKTTSKASRTTSPSGWRLRKPNRSAERRRRYGSPLAPRAKVSLAGLSMLRGAPTRSPTRPRQHPRE
jgi:hypothetical protein